MPISTIDIDTQFVDGSFINYFGLLTMQNYHDYLEEERKRKQRNKRNSVAQKLLNAYRRRKREEKIEKLKGDDGHWKGLSWVVRDIADPNIFLVDTINL